MIEMYWDEGNGKITKDSICTPIRKGTSIYVETYEVFENKRISIAYTQETLDNENMYYYRKHILNLHRIEYSDLGKLILFEVPCDVYDKWLSELKGEQK